MFEIAFEWKTLQAEGLIMSVGQHGSYDVDHIVIEIVGENTSYPSHSHPPDKNPRDVFGRLLVLSGGKMWFDFAPSGNNGALDNANINMATTADVNDNNWHTFFGERYACYIANPAYVPGTFMAEWNAGGRAGLTCSRNGKADGKLTVDGVLVSEDHGTGGTSGVDTTMPVFIGGHPDIVNGNFAAGTLS